jgi:hypothetical protein
VGIGVGIGCDVHVASLSLPRYANLLSSAKGDAKLNSSSSGLDASFKLVQTPRQRQRERIDSAGLEEASVDGTSPATCCRRIEDQHNRRRRKRFRFRTPQDVNDA